MKKTPLLAIAAAGLLSCFILGGQAFAQQGPAPARQPASSPINLAGRTVLIDVNAIFKEHARFNAQMNQLKNDADAMDTQMKKEEGQLRNMVQGLQKYAPGSPEYKKMEEDLAMAQTNWKLKVQNKRREFLQREAKAYNDAYKEIQDEVNYFCESNGVAIVLRFTSEQVDESNAESILSYINKPVVWHNRNLDITNTIKQRFVAPPVNTADKRNAPGGAQPAGNYPAPRNTAPPSFPPRQ